MDAINTHQYGISLVEHLTGESTNFQHDLFCAWMAINYDDPRMADERLKELIDDKWTFFGFLMFVLAISISFFGCLMFTDLNSVPQGLKIVFAVIFTLVTFISVKVFLKYARFENRLDRFVSEYQLLQKLSGRTSINDVKDVARLNTVRRRFGMTRLEVSTEQTRTPTENLGGGTFFAE